MMDESNIIAFVAGDIKMDEFKSQDRSLCNLLNSIVRSQVRWQTRDDIVLGKRLIPVLEIGRIYQRRLSLMPNENETPDNEWPQVLQKKNAVTQLVTFCTEHPNAHVKILIINCTIYSYNVFCGLEDELIRVICVIRGKRIPKYAMTRK